MKNSDLFSYELDEWGIYSLESCFKTREGLKFLGFDTDTFEFVYLIEKNKEEIECTADKALDKVLEIIK